MAEIFRPPFFQAESSAGVPLSGAKLYFYAATTTTPITVYQDVALGTPHLSPVVADSSGIFPAIYLSNTTYKIALYTSADVLVKTYDNINTTSSSNTVLDGAFRIQNSSDATKQIAISASSITSGQTRTVTVPDKSGTVAYTSDVSQPGFIYGLTLSTNAGDATNDIDIAAGTARDSGDTVNIALLSGITKQLDNVWAVGTNAGMLATGVAVTNTTYFIFLIKRTDTSVVDVAADTSSTGANIAAHTNAAYTIKAPIGQVTRSGGVNGRPIWYGPTAISGTTTPTVTSSVGTITTASGTISFVKTGKLVACGFTISVTTNGTGATSIKLPLPYQAEATAYVGGAGANTSTGVPVVVSPFDAATATITKYDGTYPIGSGETMSGTFTYIAVA